jgi:hypothetical protein
MSLAFRTAAVPVTLLGVALLAGCTDASPTAPSASSAAGSPAMSAVQARPFGGRCETAITPIAPQPGDPPNAFRLHIEYVCQLAHLGRTTAVAEQIVIATGPTTQVASNTTVYTAANGDQLFATWSGSSTFDPTTFNVVFSGPETYTGGTGRFAQASGSAFISGTASLSANTGEFTSEGTLSY